MYEQSSHTPFEDYHMQQLVAPSEHVKPLIVNSLKYQWTSLSPLPIPIEKVWRISPSLKQTPIFCINITNAMHDIWRQIINNLQRQTKWFVNCEPGPTLFSVQRFYCINFCTCQRVLVILSNNPKVGQSPPTILVNCAMLRPCITDLWPH